MIRIKGHGTGDNKILNMKKRNQRWFSRFKQVYQYNMC